MKSTAILIVLVVGGVLAPIKLAVLHDSLGIQPQLAGAREGRGRSGGNGDGNGRSGGAAGKSDSASSNSNASGNSRARSTEQGDDASPAGERAVVASGLSEADVAQLKAKGFRLLSNSPSVVKLAVPKRMSVQRARRAISRVNPAAVTDADTWYRPD